MSTLVADDPQAFEETRLRVARAGSAFAERTGAAAATWLMRVVVASLTAIGVVARFFSPSKMWLDEALSVNIASLPVGDLLGALEHDGHPPLYYLLLHGWIGLVGDGDMAIRALSGVFGVAALPLAWIAGLRLAGTAGARWAVLVTALSPYCVRYSTEARMYSLVMFLVLAGYLLLTAALRTPTPLRLVGVAVVSGLLLLCHYWSFWLLGAVGLLLVWRWWHTTGERPATLRSLLAMAAGALLFLPWLPSFLYQSAHTGTPWGEPFPPTTLVRVTLADMVGGINFPKATLGSALILLFVLVALFAVRTEGREVVLDVSTAPTVRGEVAVVVLTAALGCIATYALGAAYQSRYAAVFIPLLHLAVAVGITRMPGIAQVLAGGTLLAVVLLGVSWAHHRFERTQSPEVAAAIVDQAQPGDVVVYCPDQLGPDYSREMPNGLVEMSYPLLSSPDRVDWVDYAERNATADPRRIADEVRRTAGDHTIFVVWMAGYRTFGQQCERFLDALEAGRVAEHIVAPNPARYFEPANLVSLTPP